MTLFGLTPIGALGLIALAAFLAGLIKVLEEALTARAEDRRQARRQALEQAQGPQKPRPVERLKPRS